MEKTIVGCRDADKNIAPKSGKCDYRVTHRAHRNRADKNIAPKSGRDNSHVTHRPPPNNKVPHYDRTLSIINY
ncbi:hypothetical protein CKA32_002719 [Geitlerinema sp. FC II]|nr:hypothetical protein CKA32_002719 [Geitlerinema sp. FC II]